MERLIESMVLLARPSVVIESGGRYSSAIGNALLANGAGHLYCISPRSTKDTAHFDKSIPITTLGGNPLQWLTGLRKVDMAILRFQEEVNAFRPSVDCLLVIPADLLIVWSSVEIGTIKIASLHQPVVELTQ